MISRHCLVVVTNDRLLRACRLQQNDRRPVWFMRQAGRYMAAYREIRKEHGMLDICRSPELSSTVAAAPVEKFGLDAAILFSDIMIPLMEMGIELGIVEDRGPVIRNPIRSADDVMKLKELDASSLSFVYESIEKTSEKLGDGVPVIGFSGAPFTLASYLIEGGSSRDYLNVKRMMHTMPDAWRNLMDKLSAAVSDYLSGQASAGCRVVQLFDSWAGTLSAYDYREYVMPYVAGIAKRLKGEGVHVINFWTGNSALLPMMRGEDVSVVSVDWRMDIDAAWKIAGHDVGIQGNLDPAVLLEGGDYMKSRAADILERTRGRNGHIFNLGHGVLKDTPEEHVSELVEFVHEWEEK